MPYCVLCTNSALPWIVCICPPFLFCKVKRECGTWDVSSWQENSKQKCQLLLHFLHSTVSQIEGEEIEENNGLNWIEYFTTRAAWPSFFGEIITIQQKHHVRTKWIKLSPLSSLFCLVDVDCLYNSGMREKLQFCCPQFSYFIGRLVYSVTCSMGWGWCYDAKLNMKLTNIRIQSEIKFHLLVLLC